MVHLPGCRVVANGHTGFHPGAARSCGENPATVGVLADDGLADGVGLCDGPGLADALGLADGVGLWDELGLADEFGVAEVSGGVVGADSARRAPGVQAGPPPPRPPL